MAETPKPWHGRNSGAEAGGGQVRNGQERVPEAFQAREPFWREPCAGTNLNRQRSAAHGATQTPVLRPEAASPMGEWQPGRGTWNRIARVPASGKSGRMPPAGVRGPFRAYGRLSAYRPTRSVAIRRSSLLPPLAPELSFLFFCVEVCGTSGMPLGCSITVFQALRATIWAFS